MGSASQYLGHSLSQLCRTASSNGFDNKVQHCTACVLIWEWHTSAVLLVPTNMMCLLRAAAGMHAFEGLLPLSSVNPATVSGIARSRAVSSPTPCIAALLDDSGCAPCAGVYFRSYDENPKLKEFAKVLSLSTDRGDRVYVSTFEARKVSWTWCPHGGIQLRRSPTPGGAC